MQEFEAAIKKRDDIITQLTTNLQQARKEKDETMREFLELTEQSQKLQIQFQHVSYSATNIYLGLEIGLTLQGPSMVTSCRNTEIVVHF